MAAEHAPLPAPAGSPAPARDTSRALLAVLVGWLVPGMGHVLLGRVGRGLVFAVLIIGSFGLGLAHEGRLALRDERQPILTALQIVANLGVGPMDVLARFRVYGEAAYTMPMTPRGGPSDTARTTTYRERIRSATSAYGTAYLWTAGLMNLLLLFDVWDIGQGRKP